MSTRILLDLPDPATDEMRAGLIAQLGEDGARRPSTGDAEATGRRRLFAGRPGRRRRGAGVRAPRRARRRGRARRRCSHDGPVVLVFYRGAWCPYCNLQLAPSRRALADIRAAGATLVAVSPQTPDQSLTLAEQRELAFPVLSDAGNAVARDYGLVVHARARRRPRRWPSSASTSPPSTATTATRCRRRRRSSSGRTAGSASRPCPATTAGASGPTRSSPRCAAERCATVAIPRLARARRPTARRALGRVALAAVLANSTWFSATAVVARAGARLGPERRRARRGSRSPCSSASSPAASGSALLNLPDRIEPRRLIAGAAVAAAAANAGAARRPAAFAAALPSRFLVGVALAGCLRARRAAGRDALRARRAAWRPGVVVGALTLGSATPHLVRGLGDVPWQATIAATSVLALLAAVAIRPVPAGAGAPPRRRSTSAPRCARCASGRCG